MRTITIVTRTIMGLHVLLDRLEGLVGPCRVQGYLAWVVWVGFGVSGLGLIGSVRGGEEGGRENDLVLVKVAGRWSLRRRWRRRSMGRSPRSY